MQSMTTSGKSACPTQQRLSVFGAPACQRVLFRSRQIRCASTTGAALQGTKRGLQRHSLPLQATLLAAAVAVGVGLAGPTVAPAHADEDAYMSPYERRKAQAQRRKDLLQRTRESAMEKSAPAVETDNNASAPEVQAAPEPERSADSDSMSSNLKSALQQYQEKTSKAPKAPTKTETPMFKGFFNQRPSEPQSAPPPSSTEAALPSPTASEVPTSTPEPTKQPEQELPKFSFGNFLAPEAPKPGPAPPVAPPAEPSKPTQGMDDLFTKASKVGNEKKQPPAVEATDGGKPFWQLLSDSAQEAAKPAEKAAEPAKEAVKSFKNAAEPVKSLVEAPKVDVSPAKDAGKVKKGSSFDLFAAQFLLLGMFTGLSYLVFFKNEEVGIATGKAEKLIVDAYNKLEAAVVKK